MIPPCVLRVLHCLRSFSRETNLTGPKLWRHGSNKFGLRLAHNLLAYFSLVRWPSNAKLPGLGPLS